MVTQGLRGSQVSTHVVVTGQYISLIYIIIDSALATTGPQSGIHLWTLPSIYSNACCSIYPLCSLQILRLSYLHGIHQDRSGG
ncbi:hypothetical protein FB446DRAFT_756669 [Lentinula raphanica]|nr:hypothetical protein FB446DRAFT_756669 [Lentinula raphanica]